MTANNLSDYLNAKKPIISKASKKLSKHVELLFNISSIYQNNSKRTYVNFLTNLEPTGGLIYVIFMENNPITSYI